MWIFLGCGQIGPREPRGGVIGDHLFEQGRDAGIRRRRCGLGGGFQRQM